MRYASLSFLCLLSSYGPLYAHNISGTNWALPEYDGESLIDCAASAEAPGCQARLYPCESAFDLPTDINLSDISEEVRHDLTACFMALYDLYEVALWNIAPGSEPDPMLSRNADPMFNNMMFRHHRNAFGECRSDQEEKTEDWRCSAREIQIRLIDAEINAR